MSSPAMTLADYAVQRNDPLLLGIVQSLHNAGSVLQDMSFKTTGALVARGARFTHEGLPTPTFRKLNADSTIVKATASAFSEQAFIMANFIDTDDVLMRDTSLVTNPQAGQLGAYLAAASRVIDDRFINNDPLTGDADAPVGLRYRLDNPTDYGCKSALKKDFASVDMTAAAMTATTADTFLRTLDELFQEMGAPDGDGCVLYLNESLKAAFASGLRKLGVGGWGFSTDPVYGRQVEKFRSATIRTLGRGVDGTTKVITNTETTAGAAGASDYTSLYIVRYGEEHFQPWQQHEFEARNFGLVSGQNYHRISIQWPFGYVAPSEYSIARGYDIKIK